MQNKEGGWMRGVEVSVSAKELANMREGGSLWRGKVGGLEGWGLPWLRGDRLAYIETVMKGGRY